MKVITYYPYFQIWDEWMDGSIEVNGHKSSFDFISRTVADEDEADGCSVYTIPTIVLDEFSAISAAAALAHWYSRKLKEAVTVRIDGDDVECTVLH